MFWLFDIIVGTLELVPDPGVSQLFTHPVYFRNIGEHHTATAYVMHSPKLHTGLLIQLSYDRMEPFQPLRNDDVFSLSLHSV